VLFKLIICSSSVINREREPGQTLTVTYETIVTYNTDIKQVNVNVRSDVFKIYYDLLFRVCFNFEEDTNNNTVFSNPCFVFNSVLVRLIDCCLTSSDEWFSYIVDHKNLTNNTCNYHKKVTKK